jgi:hypothetical protein
MFGLKVQLLNELRGRSKYSGMHIGTVPGTTNSQLLTPLIVEEPIN